jgi:myxalamid-type polyketide synthase MxaB
VGLNRIGVYERFPSQIWCHALVHASAIGDRENIAVDLRLFDEEERILAEVDGLYLKLASRKALQQIELAGVEDWLYDISWEIKALDTGTGASKQEAGWLIFADSGGGIGDALSKHLEAHGSHCVRVIPGEDFLVEYDGLWRVNPNHPADFQNLLQEIAKTERALGRIVYLWGLDSKPGTETEQAQICGGLLHLVQALAAGGGVKSPDLWIVTRGVQPVGPDPPLLSVAQAPLWGLGGAIATEHPEYHCRRVDLDPWPESDESEALLREIWSGGGEAQVALRSNNRYVARLVPSRFTGDAAASRLELPEDRPFQLDIKKHGLLENLEFRTVTRNQPGPGEVEIRVRATGLNFKDILKALGQYTGPDILLGDECTGEITAMGEGVVGLQVGDKVVAVAQGSFGSYAISRAELVARKPGNLSFAEAATIPIAFLTAYYTLHHIARISAEKRVLIHAAAGGVGQAAVQLAQKVGAEIIATAGSPRKRAFLRSMGIQHVMDSRTLDFADKVMDITAGHGVDIVLNSLAGDFIPKSLSVVAPGGCFLEIGRTGLWEEDEVYRLRPDIAYFPVFLVDIVERQLSLIGELLRKLVAGFQAGDLKALPYRDFAINEAIDAFRYMAQAKQIGKIVLSQEDEAHRMHAGSVKDNATYLIAGGSGGLGLKAAEWLVEQGAKHLVLVGRSGANDAALDTVGKLKKLGAQVVVAKADISEEAQVGSLLLQIADTMPPLKGIIHSAGVLDDGFLIQQNWQSFDRVMAPKVNGAWNLHLLTQDKELDFFILFSSTASLLGAPGQGNYAAANAFLDALAHYRRARQLPAVSINWGPWEEVGMVAAADKRNQRRMMEQGMHFIPPATGMHILPQLLQKEVTQVGVIPIDWEKYCRYQQSGHILPFLDHLLQKTKTKKYDEKHYIQNGKEIGPAESTLDQASIENYLCEQVSRLLRLPLSSISITLPLKELGIDSLMAHELFNRVESSFGRRLPLAVLIEAPTIEQLARTICDYSYEASWSQLVEVQTGGSNPPFYCIHGHRGNILGFRELSDLIGHDTPFYALQARGMGERSFEIGIFEQIAEVYLREIQAVQPKGPYYLGGFCMGGAIAYHIAQLLQKQNEEVALLALIESAHPHFAKLRLTSGRISRIVWSIYERVDYELGNLRRLNVKEKMLYIERKIRTFKNLLQVFTERIAEMLAAPLHFNIPHSRGFELDILYDSYLKAYLNYVPGPYQGRTILFSAEKQAHGIIEDSTLGWGDLIKGEMKVIKTPGHYLNVLTEPGIQTIAKCLKEFIP